MFNEVNVDNRLRIRVRGRVIVFTTSLVVEFLEENLNHSYPLYNLDSESLAEGKALSFCVELNGNLTFDENSDTRVYHSPEPFKQVYYDPTAWSVIKPSDPFVSRITSANVNRYGNVSIFHSLPNGQVSQTEIEMVTYTGSSPSTFKVGAPWKGQNGYKPDWHYIYENGS